MLDNTRKDNICGSNYSLPIPENSCKIIYYSLNTFEDDLVPNDVCDYHDKKGVLNVNHSDILHPVIHVVVERHLNHSY